MYIYKEFAEVHLKDHPQRVPVTTSTLPVFLQLVSPTLTQFVSYRLL